MGGELAISHHRHQLEAHLSPLQPTLGIFGELQPFPGQSVWFVDVYPCLSTSAELLLL